MVAFVLGLVIIMMMKAHYKRGNPTPLALKQTSISFLLKPASFAQMAVFLASAIFSNLANTIQNIAITNDWIFTNTNPWANTIRNAARYNY